jgi:hypothetical protein
MNWLLQHPAVAPLFPSPQAIKSPHYFDINYWRGADWYASHFPTQWARHRQEKGVGSLTVVGEASPYYMFHPAVPRRVVSDVPDVRVIVILREPVSRAYSNYWDRRAFGTEDLPTFEAALDAEEGRMVQVDVDRLRNDPHYYSYEHDHHTYLARGRYAEHLRPWMDLIPNDNLLILSSDDLYHSSEHTFAKTQDFLGIPQWTGVTLDPYNRRDQPAMDPATRAQLRAYYKPHNAALYELLDRDFGWS